MVEDQILGVYLLHKPLKQYNNKLEFEMQPIRQPIKQHNDNNKPNFIKMVLFLFCNVHALLHEFLYLFK
ncbi:hypothetical protein GLOIN_2v1868773 [Rhizophagus irregularis DAOM 181602=DAOM 197198]|uniref:Uncharacterized protein n=1 Tax=Rhizophagus irregularis (strain DAOM 181602 / DAOM 197198 / MUCL 43194) TaxID=747089 RepID=A0A2P4QSI4_RHIID|nr:hypothetical protein GLOIN_2v1868773 [Rhizophagus irregularis DAOM 181602=DAOM 197198]POG80575.1 hypothetical protein GLOIN_2v1868773 [Rhizophagus irregularis DAOM 181602=DAOM 197198]|eukprot:XP_025187441.1 hypothetical protein GLOIN_2v1868773 [Rhizophagus irregularis DAOM 181602=DAOM 197198]